SQQGKLAVFEKIIDRGLTLSNPLRMAEETGQVAYEKFVSAAVGYISSLDAYLDEWIADRVFVGKTEMQHRKAFAVLIAWCRAEGIDPTLQSIDKRIALAFRDKYLKMHLGSPKSINRYLSSYRTHWNWLLDRDWIGITANPWSRTHQATKRLRGQG